MPLPCTPVAHTNFCSMTYCLQKTKESLAEQLTSYMIFPWFTSKINWTISRLPSERIATTLKEFMTNFTTKLFLLNWNYKLLFHVKAVHRNLLKYFIKDRMFKWMTQKIKSRGGWILSRNSVLFCWLHLVSSDSEAVQYFSGRCG